MDSSTVFGSSGDATFASASEQFHYDTSIDTLYFDVDGSDLVAYVPTLFDPANYIAALDFEGDGDLDGSDLVEYVARLFVPLP